MLIEIKEKVNQKLNFPLFARHRQTGKIVLFHSTKKGVVFLETEQSKKDSSGTIGHYNCSWIDITDDLAWEILPEGTKIVLTQE